MKQTIERTITTGVRLVDYKPKRYKGTVHDFVCDVNRINEVASYISIWSPDRTIVIPLVKGAKM